ncbi:unnamed protein product [Pleuronectes platessa]|uniref:Uncharacterized protein n=1 Tax=Pleuronectes platessa TaxID=8262 RepID=A0A9N7VUC1_PLEPL|nr:unnamed protein product [Pleuronectes platessa]
MLCIMLLLGYSRGDLQQTLTVVLANPKDLRWKPQCVGPPSNPVAGKRGDMNYGDLVKEYHKELVQEEERK